MSDLHSPMSQSRGSVSIAFLALDSPREPSTTDATRHNTLPPSNGSTPPYSPLQLPSPSSSTTSPPSPPPFASSRQRPSRHDVKVARDRLQTEYEYTLSTYTHFCSFGAPLPLTALGGSWRARLFAWIDCAYINGGSYWWTTLMTVLILASFVCILVQSLPQYRLPSAQNSMGNTVMNDIQKAVIAVFTFQLLIRMLTVDAYVRLQCQQQSSAHRSSSSIPYILLIFLTRPFTLIDLAAIVPFWFAVAGLVSNNFSIILILRIIRVLLLSRLLSGKIARALVMFAGVVRRMTNVLELFLIYLITGMVVFGPLIFFAESGSWDSSQGQFTRLTVTGDVDGSRETSPFTSIPDSFYWVIVTMSTLGYGDLYPTSPGGKVICSVCILSGVVMIAMPISILGTSFTKEYDDERLKLEGYAEDECEKRMAKLAMERLHAASSEGLRRALENGSLRDNIASKDGLARAPHRMLNRIRSMSTEMFDALHGQLKIGLEFDGSQPADQPHTATKRRETAEEKAAAALLAQVSLEEAKVAVMLSAAARDDAERVVSLLRDGVSASASDYDKRSGLHVAASEGALRVVQALLDRGAEVNALDRFGHTPFDDATKQGDTDVIEVIEAAGGIHSDAYHKELPLSKEAALAAQLLNEAASEEVRVALLLFAASRDDVERCRMLLDSGVLPSAMDYDQRSALHIAASDAAVNVLELLIERRADVQATDRWGHTPLDDAVTYGHVRENTDALIEAGATHSQEFIRSRAAQRHQQPQSYPRPQDQAGQQLEHRDTRGAGGTAAPIRQLTVITEEPSHSGVEKSESRR